MNTRERFYAIQDALHENGQLELIGEPRMEGSVYEIANLPQIKEAIEAWDSFPWSETPQNLREDIAYLASIQAVPADHFNRMRDRLRQFSSDQLVRADPMQVLEDAVADFDDELYQLEVNLKGSVQQTLERAARAIAIPEALIVDGHISEPRFSQGSLAIYWPMLEDQARTMWDLAMYCWQELKALLIDPATKHLWSVFADEPAEEQETIQKLKQAYIQSRFGADDTLNKICETEGIGINDVKMKSLEIGSMEIEEDVTFKLPLAWRRRRKCTVYGVSMTVRDEQMVIPEDSAAIMLDVARSMSNGTGRVESQPIASDTGTVDG